MLSIFWPIGATLALAFLSDLAGSSRPRRHRKSIEVCTAMCRMTWMKEDGVLRVYSETTHLDCTRIVVELAPGAPPRHFPGDVEGHPVTVKMGGDAYGATAGAISPEGAAAADAISRLKHWGRQMEMRAGGSHVRFIPASGEHQIIILHRGETMLHPDGRMTTVGGPLSEQEKKILGWYATKNKSLGTIRQLDDTKTLLSYYPTRHGR